MESECEYKQYKNTLTSILRKTEKNYYDELLCQSKSNIKKTWGTINATISILSNLNNYHSLEVVERVSETQLQVGENSNWIICGETVEP